LALEISFKGSKIDPNAAPDVSGRKLARGYHVIAAFDAYLEKLCNLGNRKPAPPTFIDPPSLVSGKSSFTGTSSASEILFAISAEGQHAPRSIAEISVWDRLEARLTSD
jgi:hypothetical protein